MNILGNTGIINDEDPPENFYEKQQEKFAKMAEERMKAAEQDPTVDWTNLTDEDTTAIIERCHQLFNSFIATPIQSLYDLQLPLSKDFQNLTLDGIPPFDTDSAKYIVERYEEKGDLDFEAEFGMGKDAMIMALLYGVWEEKNATNIDFTPICDHVKMDFSTYCFLKRGLRSYIKATNESERDDVKAMRQALYESVCTPIDLAILLTMARAEASGWPYKPVEWEKIAQESEVLTAEDIRAMDELLLEEGKKLSNATPEIVNNCEKERQACKELNDDLEALKTRSKLSIHIINRCIDRNKDEEFEAMRAAQKKINTERMRLLNDYIPDFAEESDPITDDMIKAAERDTEEAGAECLRLRQLLNVKTSKKTLKSRLCLKKGQFCLAKADSVDMGFQEAQIIKQVNETTYMVRFLKENEGPAVEVELSNIANAELPLCEPEFEKMGFMALRVIAWVEVPRAGWMWCPGTIGGRPNQIHGSDLLVFFDHNRDGYVEGGPRLNRASKEVANYKQALVKKPRFSSEVEAFEWLRPILQDMKIFPLCQQVFSPCGNKVVATAVHTLITDIPTKCRFIQRYFEKCPMWPLVTMKKPSADRPPQQILVVDPLQKITVRLATYCVHVDRHMCVLRYQSKNLTPGSGCFEYPCTEPTHQHRDEWLYRGSPHLSAVTMEESDNNNFSNRYRLRNRMRIEQASIAPEKLDSLNLARKSGQPQAVGRVPYRNKAAEAAKKAQAKKKAREFTLVPVKLPELPVFPLVAHDSCSRGCLQGLDQVAFDKKFEGISPLVIPLFCGWKRCVYKFKHKKKVAGKPRRKPKSRKLVIYRAPCNKTFGNLDQISQFLTATESSLTIDLFSFAAKVNVLKVVTVNPKAVLDEDYTKGNEFFKIPAVNTLDDEEPPKIVYCARRFPYNEHVNVSTINSNFCSGCSCNGDCSDASKCECQRLTRENIRILGRSFRPKYSESGYGFRRLKGRTISGIYECNDNCGCNKEKCHNRVVQHDMKFPLQLFKTAGCGWGVRAVCDIPVGAFLGNYMGALMTDGIADHAMFLGQDTYFADLDLNDVVEREKSTAVAAHGILDTGLASDDDLPVGEEEEEEVPPKEGPPSSSSDSDNERNGRRLRKRPRRMSPDANGAVPAEKPLRRRKMNETERRKNEKPPEDANKNKFVKWDDYFGEDNCLYVVDAKHKGNIGRFLNHSCDPNVRIQQILVDTHDLRLPWTAFFALKTIKAGDELCWDYGYSVDSLIDDRPAEHQMFCQCGASCCEGRLL